MNTSSKSVIFALLLASLLLSESCAQIKLYSLDECISYALKNSTTIGRASNHIESEASALVEQLSGQINPSLGLSLSIPIYQRKKVKNNIKQAEIQYKNYQYNLTTAENNQTQSKYNMILQNRIVNYYMGNPIKL